MERGDEFKEAHERKGGGASKLAPREKNCEVSSAAFANRQHDEAVRRTSNCGGVANPVMDVCSFTINIYALLRLQFKQGGVDDRKNPTQYHPVSQSELNRTAHQTSAPCEKD